MKNINVSNLSPEWMSGFTLGYQVGQLYYQTATGTQRTTSTRTRTRKGRNVRNRNGRELASSIQTMPAKSRRIAEYWQKHPQAQPNEVAKALNLRPNAVGIFTKRYGAHFGQVQGNA
jgi:hypothetical protein